VTIYTVLWIVWIGIFGAIEGRAIANKAKGDTLSEHVWKWFAVTSTDKATRSRRVLLLCGLVWLSVHFLSGGRFV
jgi:hypothetical protein